MKWTPPFRGHSGTLVQSSFLAPERLLAFESVLLALPRQEREVLELRYGLLDGELHTLEEVSRAFGVTRERIRQIERQTLKKLQAVDQDDDNPDEPEPEGGLGVREPRRPKPPGWSGAVALPIPDFAGDG